LKWAVPSFFPFCTVGTHRQYTQLSLLHSFMPHAKNAKTDMLLLDESSITTLCKCLTTQQESVSNLLMIRSKFLGSNSIF